MRLGSKLALAAAVATLTAVLAHAELVLDVRTPRSDLVEAGALSSGISILMGDYHKAEEAMQAKYGPSAKTLLQLPGAKLTTVVDGKVVEEGTVRFKFAKVLGLFAIGPRGHIETRFPFDLDPRELPRAGDHSAPSGGVKSRFANQLPAKYLDFDDRDATTDTCIGLSQPDWGTAGTLLRLESGTFCVVYWRGSHPASMLIGVALAPGDPWLRPFARRICRGLTALALERVAAIDREPPPDYAACVLVDRPQRSGASETLTAHVYEVRRDATLALISRL
jgi:hypothetical protein